MNKLSVFTIAAVGTISSAFSDVHVVPAGTAESVTPDTAAAYSAFDGVKVSDGATLEFPAAGTLDFTPPLEVQAGGQVVCSNGADVVLDANTITVKGRMTVTNATLRPKVPTGSVGALEKAIVSTGTLRIEDDAVVTNRFQIGKDWESGQVVQRGGSVVNLGQDALNANSPSIGYGGGAYYELRGGTHELVGSAYLGKTSYGSGVFAMYGGSLKQGGAESACVRAGGGNCANAYYQMGGEASFRAFTANACLAAFEMAVIGPSTRFSADTFSAVDNDWSYGVHAPTVLTIGDGATWNGGLSASRASGSSAYKSTLVFVVNFNGATVSSQATYFSTSKDDATLADNPSVRNVIYSGGLTMAGDTRSDLQFVTPLRGASGKGVARVIWDSDKAYSSCPVVVICDREGGHGYGAMAVPEYDPATGRISDIRVVAPGCDYDEPFAYLLIGHNSSGETLGASMREELKVETAESAPGGDFTLKTWAEFKTWNSYRGATVLCDSGIFDCRADWALPRGTALKLRGPNTKVVLNDTAFELKSIGGTGGEFRPDWNSSKYKGTLPVECLDIETSRSLILSSLTLSVTGRWDVAVSDLTAGKCADYDSTISFGETATLNVDGALPDDAVRTRFVIAKASNGITGLPILTGTHAANWRISKVNGEVVLSARRGMMVIFR